MGRRLFRLAVLVLLVHLAALALGAAWPAGEGPADVVVVLGSTANPDGTPHPRLEARLEAGLAVYREGRARRILVSGAVGKEGPDEAEVMAGWLLARGVPADDVLVDHGGANTWLTALHTREMLDRRGLRTAAVATSWFHALRTRMALAKVGVPVTETRASRFVELREPWSVAREMAALWAYAAKDAPVEGGGGDGVAEAGAG